MTKAQETAIARAAAHENCGCEWRDQLEALIDIYDDGQLPFDHRCYVDGSFGKQIDEARALLAAAPAAPTEGKNKAERNRASNNPGGMECVVCGCIFIGDETHECCGICSREPDVGTAHANAMRIVHEEAGRTLSKGDFDMCMRIAKRAAHPAPTEDAPDATHVDESCVICPGCAHQFRAISVNDQKRLAGVSDVATSGEIVGSDITLRVPLDLSAIERECGEGTPPTFSETLAMVSRIRELEAKDVGVVTALTEERIFQIRDSIRYGDGWDGDAWDLAMARAIEQALRRPDPLLAECVEALESIWRYGSDTLSGRFDGPDDREWQRAAVVEMCKRAQPVLAKVQAAKEGS